MKLKSHSGTKKRVKQGKNVLYFVKSSKRHLLINKSKRQKKLFPRGKQVDPADQWKINRLLAL